MAARGSLPARFPALAAALLAGAMLAACAQERGNTGERVLFTALAGEAPGARPVYIDLMGDHPLGRPPPQVGGRVYRPPAVPETEAQSETGRRTKETYARLRLRLSDRDDVLQFRRRSLRVALGAYSAAIEALSLEHGDPLPPYSDTTRTRIADARQALDSIRADLLQLSNVLAGARSDARLIAAVRERAQSAAAGLAQDNPDRALVSEILERLDEAADTVETMQADVADEIGGFVEYLEGQRQALDDFERQVKAAGDAPADTGSDAPGILQRQSIIDP